MDYVLYDISAFRYHRIPPQVLVLLPMVSSADLTSNAAALMKHPLVAEVFHAPVHVLSTQPGASSVGERVVRHVCTRELPFGAVHETYMGIKVASPLLTLLSIAPSVSFEKLLMAVYEMCGTFAVFEPSDFLEDLLASAYEQRLLDPSFGWERCVDAAGRPTNLWRRPPLIEIDELHQFVNDVTGFRGAKKLRAAVNALTGVVASPFEARASMLLSLSRQRGGEQLPVANNVDIVLSRAARRIGGRQKCVADILIEGSVTGRAVIIECQGAAFHGSFERAQSDSDRTTALQAMGYDVILLTHDQIADERNFATVVSLIREKLGIRERPMPERQAQRIKALRNELFDDWESFI